MAAVIRVLIADDHLIFRMGLKSLLNNEPDIAVVGEAMTGAQTIEKFRALRPDVVVLDLRMTGMNGLDLLRHLTAIGSRIPVIILTAHGDDETRQRSLEAGAVAFLKKPFQSATLLDAVRTALGSV